MIPGPIEVPCSTTELMPHVYVCPRGDSNPYGLSATGLSNLRVYQFRHLGN